MGGGNFTAWVELAGRGSGVKTAWEYHNQPSILPQVYAAGLRREDVMLETMLPCGGAGDPNPEPMNASYAEFYIKQDLELLNTSYVDLLLLHHTCASQEETAAVWKALEAALRRGDAKAIGVSNFDAADLSALLAVAEEPISVNEAHFAVGIMDHDTIALAKAHGIALVSFSSLAAGVPTDHPVVAGVAQKHNVSGAQVMYKYVSAHGIAVLSSMSSNPAYVAEDLGIFDFDLDALDMRALDALQTSKRTCTDCFNAPCQACATKLLSLGCPVGKMPAWGRDNPDSAKCLACAATAAHNATVMETCGAQYMVTKACGQAGGFPKTSNKRD
eukprot:g1425.t1